MEEKKPGLRAILRSHFTWMTDEQFTKWELSGPEALAVYYAMIAARKQESIEFLKFLEQNQIIANSGNVPEDLYNLYTSKRKKA